MFRLSVVGLLPDAKTRLLVTLHMQFLILAVNKEGKGTGDFNFLSLICNIGMYDTANVSTVLF